MLPRSPQGAPGILSLAVDAAAGPARAIRQIALRHARVLTSDLHETVRRVSGLLHNGWPNPTARETASLRWAACNKRSGAIVQLVRLSENIANFRLGSTKRKLNIFHRQHAVFGATLQQLSQPLPLFNPQAVL